MGGPAYNFEGAMRSCSGDAKGEPACTGRSGRRGHALVRLHGGTTSALLARRLDAAGDSRLGRILGEVRGVQAVWSAAHGGGIMVLLLVGVDGATGEKGVEAVWPFVMWCLRWGSGGGRGPDYRGNGLQTGWGCCTVELGGDRWCCVKGAQCVWGGICSGGHGWYRVLMFWECAGRGRG